MSKNKTLLTLSVSLIAVLMISFMPSRVFSQAEYGPDVEHLYFKTVRSPDAQLTEFKAKTVDVVTDLIRPADTDEYAKTGIITSTPGYHMCYVASNLRMTWMGPQTGGAPGSSLRKAIAYVFPKDTLIATLFKYLVGRLDTFVPPSLAEWYNPGVTKYDYNPTAAYNTLIAGGWTYNSGYGTWEHVASGAIAGGTDKSIEIMSPLTEVAPTSFTIVARLVDEMNNLKNPTTSAPTPIKATHAPTDFNEIISRVYELHDFEMFFLCWGLSSNPDFLYNFFHSSQDVVWGDNSPGIQYPALDAKLEILMFGLNHAAKVQACKDAQQLLSDTLPYITVYSRNYFNAHQTDITGVVLSPGLGVDTSWTWCNINSPRDSALYKTPLTQQQGKIVTWCLGEIVESLNWAQTSSVYAVTCLTNMYDGLIDGNPYTGADIPWLASSWSTTGPWTGTTPHGVSVTNGQYIEFTLDPAVVAGNVLWHDGNTLDASDIIFSWKYIWDNELTNYLTFYENLVDVDSPAANKVVAYWDVTSQWLLYDAAGAATSFAPQVWGKIDTDADGQNYSDNNDIEGDASIRAWKPETKDYGDTLGAYPASTEFPWLTQVIGTGPFVFYKQTVDRYNADLFAFDVRSQSGTPDANLHYWKSNAWITNSKIQWFYEIGDVNKGGNIDITDLGRVGQKSGQTGTPGWIDEDLVRDGVINVYDLATVGKNYGKVREY